MNRRVSDWHGFQVGGSRRAVGEAVSQERMHRAEGGDEEGRASKPGMSQPQGEELQGGTTGI